MKRKKIYTMSLDRENNDQFIVSHNCNLVSLDEIITKIDNINIKDKSLYRYDKLSLPRIKVDKLKEDHDISITRNKDNADFRVVSIKGLTNNNDTSPYVLSHFYTCAPYIGELKKQIKIQSPNKYLDLLSILEKLDDDDHIQLHYSLRDLISIEKQSSDGIVISNDKWDEISVKDNLLLDQDLVALCNSNAPIIDKEQYFNMIKMIKSNDNQNISLVNEILANCNLEKSFDYVALIYYFYNNYLRYASNWNNINVKSLRDRMSVFDTGRSDGKHRGWYYKQFIKLLIAENKFTKFAYKVVQRYIHKNVIDRALDNRIDSEGIKVIIDPDSIKLSKEYEQYII